MLFRGKRIFGVIALALVGATIVAGPVRADGHWETTVYMTDEHTPKLVYADPPVRRPVCGYSGLGIPFVDQLLPGFMSC